MPGYVIPITQMFPPEWQCEAIVLRDGGRDDRGNNLPETTHTVPHCLVGQSITDNIIDRADDPEGQNSLYAPVGADFIATDRVIVPPGHFMQGLYRVDGQPGSWPLGTVVKLAYVRKLTTKEVETYGPPRG